MYINVYRVFLGFMHTCIGNRKEINSKLIIDILALGL